MPQIVVTANGLESRRGPELMRERVSVSDLESDQFIAHLVQRIEWALADADSIESRDSRGAVPTATAPERRRRPVLPAA